LIPGKTNEWRHRYLAKPKRIHPFHRATRFLFHPDNQVVPVGVQNHQSYRQLFHKTSVQLPPLVF